MESADSIRSLYRHFLSGITAKSLNAFYYACSYAKVDCSVFMNVTAKQALRLIPADLGSQPLFGSLVYFKKITVTPDDERAWFRKHPQPFRPVRLFLQLQFCVHFFCFCWQAFPQKHGLAVGKSQQVGEHPKPGAQRVLLADVPVDQQPDFF